MKKKIKFIKDLPPNQNLGGIKFKHPETGEICIWTSQWQRGIFYKKDIDDSQIFPLFVNDIKEALKFELVQ